MRERESVGEYGGRAEELLDRINSSVRVLAKEIPDIMGGGHSVNCYPGEPGAGCHHEALLHFIKQSASRSRAFEV